LLPFWAFNAVTEATDRSSALHAPLTRFAPKLSFIRFRRVDFCGSFFVWGLPIKPVDDA